VIDSACALWGDINDLAAKPTDNVIGETTISTLAEEGRHTVELLKPIGFRRI
jgi:hypothetical protein